MWQPARGHCATTLTVAEVLCYCHVESGAVLSAPAAGQRRLLPLSAVDFAASSMDFETRVIEVSDLADGGT